MDLNQNANASLEIPDRFLSLLCHTFPQGRSQRWLWIFKNAFNMVSICHERLRVKLLSGKKHRFVRLSRNLAFRCHDNSIKMTLRQKKALKTCSEVIEAHPSELPAWNRSTVDIMTQNQSNIDRVSPKDHHGTVFSHFSSKSDPTARQPNNRKPISNRYAFVSVPMFNFQT